MYLNPEEIPTALAALRYRQAWCMHQGYFALAQDDTDLIAHIENSGSFFPALTGRQTLHLQSALMRRDTPQALSLVRTLANRAK